MLVKLNKSISITNLEKEFPGEGQEIQCILHELGVKKRGATFNVNPTVYKEDGIDYYGHPTKKIKIPVDWVVKVDPPVKYIEEMPKTFTTQDVIKGCIDQKIPKQKALIRARASLFYATKKGYITRVSRGKYVKV